MALLTSWAYTSFLSSTLYLHLALRIVRKFQFVRFIYCFPFFFQLSLLLLRKILNTWIWTARDSNFLLLPVWDFLNDVSLFILGENVVLCHDNAFHFFGNAQEPLAFQWSVSNYSLQHSSLFNCLLTNKKKCAHHRKVYEHPFFRQIP